jgi:hypothetical protein
MGGVIASSGDYTLAKNNSDGVLRTERSVATPNIAIQGSVTENLVVPDKPDSRAEYILVFQSLQCHSTDAGGANPDQVSLYVKNQLVWGPSPMSAGDIADVTTVGGTVFKNTVPLQIHVGSRHLDLINISSVPGGESQSITFTDITASYTLTYQTVLDLR